MKNIQSMKRQNHYEHTRVTGGRNKSNGILFQSRYIFFHDIDGFLFVFLPFKPFNFAGYPYINENKKSLHFITKIQCNENTKL